jgi:hypothetical protein
MFPAPAARSDSPALMSVQYLRHRFLNLLAGALMSSRLFEKPEPSVQ